MSKEALRNFEEQERGEIGAKEEALYKVIAESSCLVYQLTKIPIIKKVDQHQNPFKGCLFMQILGLGAENLYQTLLQTATGDRDEVLKACNIRTQLFCQALSARINYKGSLRAAWQSEGAVWSKVCGEEVSELVQEADSFLALAGEDDFPGLKGKIREIEVTRADFKQRDVGQWLRWVFELASFLGVKSELNLFEFMAEKQQGRIAMGKQVLSPEDKKAEWQKLLPRARKYFN
ncbi:MAG TPA: hypothetical protein VMW25_04935 [Clostridia bacterium]|nr:hypothetical protein [Clostridia bacterium]